MPDEKKEARDMKDWEEVWDEATVADADELPQLPPDCVELPMIPLRGMVIFPHSVIHLDVGRPKSIQALDEAMLMGREIFFAMQKEVQVDEPNPDDVYAVGTVGEVRQVLKLPGGTVRLMIVGLCRATLEYYSQLEPYAVAVVKEHYDPERATLKQEAMKRRLRDAFAAYAGINRKYPPEAPNHVKSLEAAGELADTVASYLFLPLAERQRLLETFSLTKRMEMLLEIIAKETEILDLERKIGNRVHSQIDKNQKEYYLREQLRAISHELGDGEDRGVEIDEFRARMEGRDLPDYVVERLEKEFSRLRHMPTMTAEANVVENYIDWVLDMPWGIYTEDSLDLAAAERILNEDHYGLTKVKERILEFLAVRQLTDSLKGPILCLVGPPGVGKTSLAASIAKALGRKYVRLSLGGVHDEAEIRGHRRTYIGSQPGRIMQYMKNAGSSNPLFLLDEIDKMASDFRGDPTSAMLEVLDPAQNSTFSDHYLEMPYDLSKVLFITTANVEQDIPEPLWDRMEIVRLDSYTEDEKLEIAVRHLLPRQLKEHGLNKNQLTVGRPALLEIIRNYTREAGVRSLERRLAKLCRKTVKGIVAGQFQKLKIGKANLREYLGEPDYHYDRVDKADQVGVVNGLAWTAAGGDTLTIEAQLLPGKGNLLLTGQLGDVMKESAQAGWTYLRSLAVEDKSLKVPEDVSNIDIHIHVPEGAIPKDGPSAGITMACALASVFSRRPVRHDVAMTGEITLRGRVLPIGGLKEKTIAAHRAGVKTVIIPEGNRKDLAELPKVVRDNLEFICVENLAEVLRVALAGPKTEPTPDSKPEQKTEPENAPEAKAAPVKRRGRPKKQQPKPEPAFTDETGEAVEDVKAVETSDVPEAAEVPEAPKKRRGRPKRVKAAIENTIENTAESTVENITENTPENLSDNIENIIEDKPAIISENVVENAVEDAAPEEAPAAEEAVEAPEAPKKRRGRPKKADKPVADKETASIAEEPKKRRGRPKKTEAAPENLPDNKDEENN